MESNRYIFEFAKTNHFLLRQQERQIDDRLLRYVLIKIKRKFRTKTNILVTTSTMKVLASIGLYSSDLITPKNLMIVIHENSLITVYYLDSIYRHMKRNYEKAEFIFL